MTDEMSERVLFNFCLHSSYLRISATTGAAVIVDAEPGEMLTERRGVMHADRRLNRQAH
jgi:hypothetical protein